MALKEELSGMLVADQKELLQVQEKLNTLNDKLIDLKKSIESTEYLLAHKFGVQESKTDETAQYVMQKKSFKRYFKNSIPNLVYEMLLESKNKPLHKKEIVNRLLLKGKKVENPNSIPTSLGRDERFKNIGSNTFVIVDEVYQKESASS